MLTYIFLLMSAELFDTDHSKHRPQYNWLKFLLIYIIYVYVVSDIHIRHKFSFGCMILQKLLSEIRLVSR